MRSFDWHFLLETFRGISSIPISVPKIIIWNILRICTMVSLYSVFFVDNDKTKCISNLFSWSNYNDCYAFIREFITKRVPLFKHVSTIEVSWVW